MKGAGEEKKKNRKLVETELSISEPESKDVEIITGAPGMSLTL